LVDEKLLVPLRRDDVPRGLVFALGYRVEPGSRFVFLRSSDGRRQGTTTGGFHAQSRDSLDYLKRLAAQVSPQAQIAKVRRYMTSGRGHRTPETFEIWNEAFGGELPASTALEVPGTTLFGSVVDLEGWAIAPAAADADPLRRFPGRGLTPEVVSVRGDQKLCVAAVRPEASGSVEREVRSCLSMIDAEFSQHGAGPDDVAKLTVYFRDPRSWEVIEGMIFGKYGDRSPVVNGVIVSNLSTPGGHVEVTGWARVSPEVGGDGVATVDLRDRLLLLTGTGAIRIFMGGEAPQMYAQTPPGTIEEQAHVGMQNQQKVLEAAGATFDDVFRSNWYVTDIRDWDVIEPIVTEYFGRTPPVPMVVEVSRLTAKQGVRFEPDLWAVLPHSASASGA
jgi:2-iminobutanoate/2-iminopropanoate deaminase